MKKILYALLATVSGLVLLFSYKTSLEVVTPDASPDQSTSNNTPTQNALRDGTFTGDAVSTRYGPVQARITIAGGVITAADVTQYPSSNGRDRQINGRAVPQLVSETLQAQSSSVDMVSGATYTSTGYVRSLQSAIDQAQP
jgi:uncharacterized protein with FMN-binding domain